MVRTLYLLFKIDTIMDKVACEKCGTVFEGSNRLQLLANHTAKKVCAKCVLGPAYIICRTVSKTQKDKFKCVKIVARST